MHIRPLKVMVILGTRPEAIKLAPVIRELQRYSRDFRLTLCATGQHRELFDQVQAARPFRMPLHHELQVMKPNQNLDELTANLLVGISGILKRVRPNLIIVQGDTSTALVGTLAGFYHRIKAAHIEAGLRTQDRFAPFPEEINRRLVAQMADFHFAPTEWARWNLIREGVPRAHVFVTGNTVLDTFLAVRRRVAKAPPRVPELDGVRLSQGKKLILVTAHRRESFGAGIINICSALRGLAELRKDIEIVFLVHPNPNVYGPVHQRLGGIPRIHLIPPLASVPFTWLMSKAYLALTDSGGIQEEMPSLRRPVLVMRDKTERPEGLKAGVCKLVGTDPGVIKRTVLRLLVDRRAYKQFSRNPNPFGDGKASRRIVQLLRRELGRPERSTVVRP